MSIGGVVVGFIMGFCLCLLIFIDWEDDFDDRD